MNFYKKFLSTALRSVFDYYNLKIKENYTLSTIEWENGFYMQNGNETWMRRALELAHKAADAGEVPVGAVIVSADEIVGEGYNQPISTHDASAHAEIVALRDAGINLGNYRLPGSTVYVTIEPCTMCVGALIHARVERVVFGAREPKAGALVSNLQLHESPVYNHSLSIEEGLLQDECSALISSFFRNKRSAQ